MTQFMEMVGRMRSNYNRVTAVMTGTGDRRDQDIREVAGIVARGVDEIIVKESTLRRGRAVGEIPRLLKEGAMAAGLPEERISFVEKECEAVIESLRRAQPNDFAALKHQCPALFRVCFNGKTSGNFFGRPSCAPPHKGIRTIDSSSRKSTGS